MMRRKSCQVMIKPTGSVCNLDCKYCFYLEKEKLYPERKRNYRMSDEMLERFIKQHIAAQEIDEVIFAWQGGEPTLMGLPFYRRAIELQQRYAAGKTIVNTFQTNGILIDDQWSEFFRANQFLVGISIDGDAALHDEWRVTRSGKATHAKVEQAIQCLHRHGVEFNTLTVVNQSNMRHPLQVYRYLKSIGSRYMQFIPLVERSSEKSGLGLAHPEDRQTKMMPWSVDPLQFGHFLNAIFDVWVREDIGDIGIQMFEQTLAAWCGLPPQVCVFAPTCGSAFAMEMNGDVYNCDHFVYPQYRLGNIQDTTLHAMNNSAQNQQFGDDKSHSMAQECRSCQWQFACYGGCPKHRFLQSATGERNHNYLCAGYKAFFSHSAVTMSAMKTLHQNGFSPAEIKSIFV
ncbi:TPA: anaerobic sulfatase maturase [Klebsiella quasipneumoniae subsp. quasipneumoniae]|uniref:anaerobic sulfatase maturase n=1 Tax=Klebsiella quasipneumoniae TaxID=1463165 RepID=UPI000B4213DA|nr:anaerobic sulfatase maturase [Klebsiella quasipneumoniae]MDS0461645.1 anaerobic sulfatase maturase [Klebsiella pneumoniae]EKZ5678618.1 anaerobic sulfatase maturase [Klebsiella quasipneumoniae]EMF1933836.1 anaerobic sulfatase maturase [Klebsiella quasipneumoniae]MCW9323671.1 anaerobic sulfatase maturase [Klebsiella quasipneumoniae]MCW9332306.1 anaerobic sulfatase maturase [Klebsiella quasipneumoniae]